MVWETNADLSLTLYVCSQLACIHRLHEATLARVLAAPTAYLPVWFFTGDPRVPLRRRNAVCGDSLRVPLDPEDVLPASCSPASDGRSSASYLVAPVSVLLQRLSGVRGKTAHACVSGAPALAEQRSVVGLALPEEAETSTAASPSPQADAHENSEVYRHEPLPSSRIEGRTCVGKHTREADDLRGYGQGVTGEAASARDRPALPDSALVPALAAAAWVEHYLSSMQQGGSKNTSQGEPMEKRLNGAGDISVSTPCRVHGLTPQEPALHELSGADDSAAGKISSHARSTLSRDSTTNRDSICSQSGGTTVPGQDDCLPLVAESIATILSEAESRLKELPARELRLLEMLLGTLVPDNRPGRAEGSVAARVKAAVAAARTWQRGKATEVQSRTEPFSTMKNKSTCSDGRIIPPSSPA